MRHSLAVVLCLSLALIGCKAKEALDAAGISRDLQKKGTTDLMKEVAEDTYDAPADGKITERQMQMYLKVREEEKKIARVAREEAKQHTEKAKGSGERSLSGMIQGFKTLGSMADLVTADLRAAKQLGYNSQEYLWVKGQVLAVSGAAMADEMNQALNKQMETAIAQAKKARDEATDEATRKMYADMLASYEENRNEMKFGNDNDPALAHNRAIVKKYENEMNAYAAELEKYTDAPQK